MQLLLLPGMVGFLRAAAARRGRRLLLALPLVWAAALILLYAATLPLEFQHGRYVIPALPAAIYGGRDRHGVAAAARPRLADRAGADAGAGGFGGGCCC